MKTLNLFFSLFLLFNTSQLFSQTKLEFENLGNLVNSEFNEISPIISPDGKTLYFVRCNHPKNKFREEDNQDIWSSELKNGQWTQAVHMGSPFNKGKYNGILNVTPDGNTLLIRGAHKEGEYIGNGYSFAQRKRKGWSKPEKIKIKKLDILDKGVYSSAYLTNDGKALIMTFCTEPEGTNNDLFVSFSDKEGVWSKPKSLGLKINTDFNEVSPFMAADGVTLYFASDRPGGFGKTDIYMTRRNDDSWTNWTEPKNLGSSINTIEEDAYYSIDASGQYAYMTSSINSYGLGDIVKFKLEKEFQPDPVVIIYGNVYNKKTGEPLEAIIEYEILSENGKPAGVATSEPDSGSYKIVLPYGKHYGFSAHADGFMAISDNIDLSEVAEYKEIKRDLYLVPIEVGQIIRLQNIFFDFGNANLRAESYPELNRVLTFLNQNPSIKIEVGGHTDNVGSDDFNKNLSQNRANSVMNYLISKGIKADRIVAKGYGESKPIETNDTDEGRQLNRRVEFIIMNK